MQNIFIYRSYIPILAISPAEMTAVAQLPDKEKDQLLPLFPLRGWVGSHRLRNTLARISEAINERPWIADIDEKFLSENKIFLFTGKHPETPIYQELKDLLNPNNAYENWCEFIKKNENTIPCIRHETLEGIDEQIRKLRDLNRGIVFRISPDEHNLSKHEHIIHSLRSNEIKNILIIYDLGAIDQNFRERQSILEKFMQLAKENIKEIAISVSASSFPSGFAGQREGENSIYERILFNSIESKKIYSPLIYSDRGSARASKQDGGSGTPPPRIDYPMKKDWKFVRREIDDDAPGSKERRRAAYIEIAKEVVSADYWLPNLRLWGTQQIELTAEENTFGIFSAQKATAARINIHIFVQLHYNSVPEEIDTDEEWVD
ncbi:hypothetical protein AB4J20_24855 [Pseudomonas aeruginosa]|uniref:beta family protein n=1 Tax=Pseudomonas aeruginosa TaxID=287 RepID=UPI003D0001D8